MKKSKITVNYNGKETSLYSLCDTHGVNYSTAYCRYRQGERDINRLLRTTTVKAKAQENDRIGYLESDLVEVHDELRRLESDIANLDSEASINSSETDARLDVLEFEREQAQEKINIMERDINHLALMLDEQRQLSEFKTNVIWGDLRTLLILAGMVTFAAVVLFDKI